MAFVSFNKLWESDSDNIVFKKDKLQDININQLKLEVHDTYRNDEKLTTDFEPNNNEDVISKAFLDEKLVKINGNKSFWKKITTNVNYNTTSNL